MTFLSHHWSKTPISQYKHMTSIIQDDMHKCRNLKPIQTTSNKAAFLFLNHLNKIFSCDLSEATTANEDRWTVVSSWLRQMKSTAVPTPGLSGIPISLFLRKNKTF